MMTNSFCAFLCVCLCVQTVVCQFDNETTTQRPRPTRHTTLSDDDYDDPTTQPPQHIYKDRGNIACPGMCVEAHLSHNCDVYNYSPELCAKPWRHCCILKKNWTFTMTPAPKRTGHKCQGDCISEYFFSDCDNLDEDAVCPGGDVCCIDEDKDPETTTKRPTIHIPATPNYPTSNIVCPGVCVEARLSQYCEAYLNLPDLCVKGRLCCVSKDNYGDRPPLDLVVPNEKKYSTKRLTTALTTTPAPKQRSGHKCRGKCILGWFSLFCDNVDEDAVCPGEGVCCINENKAAETTTSSPTTHISTTPPPLPRCPGHCMHNIMAAFCNPPAVILHRTECNAEGWICCDNTREPPPTTRRPTTTTTATTTTTTTTTTAAAPADRRLDCSGSYIMSRLSFTCFYHETAKIEDKIKTQRENEVQKTTITIMIKKIIINDNDKLKMMTNDNDKR